MPYVIETSDEFRTRHSPNGEPAIKEGHRRLLPDGAVMVLVGLPGTDDWQLVEPPGDELDRLRAVKHYWAISVAKAEHDFKRCRDILITGRISVGQGGSMPARFDWPAEYGEQPSREVAMLEKIKAVVKHRRQKLAEADAAIFDHPANVAARERAAEMRRANERFEQQEAARCEALLAVTLDDSEE